MRPGSSRQKRQVQPYLPEISKIEPNDKIRKLLGPHNHVLYEYVQTHRTQLYRQSILDQFPRARTRTSPLRVFPHTMPFGGIQKVQLSMLQERTGLSDAVVDIIHDYLDVPADVINSIEFLPIHRRRRDERARLAVQLLDTITVALLMGQDSFACPFHGDSEHRSCLYNIYLFLSHDATNIIKNIIRVLGKRQTYVRIGRTTVGGCMTFNRSIP